MKLKTYLRGLGIGIIVTTIIMMIIGGGREKLSDEEIIARAKGLGMVEQSEGSPEAGDEKKSEVREEIGEAGGTDKPDAEGGSQAGSENVPGNEEESKSDLGGEETARPDADEVTAGDVVPVVISDDEDAAAISKKLEELGLVISSAQFARYLNDNEYAEKISPGSYEIAIGSSEETIARIITNSR